MSGNPIRMNDCYRSGSALSETFRQFWQSMLQNNSDKQSYWNMFIDQIQSEKHNSCLNYNNYTLKSAFQPIFSITHRRPVGYEALLRSFTNKSWQSVSPGEVFNHARIAGQGTEVDIMCHTLHTFNFEQLNDINNNWLFLNTKPSSLVKYSLDVMDFREMLNWTGLKPEQIVIEVLEVDNTNDHRVEAGIEYFKDMGCQIAIDDFGAGHSNFERVWRLEPDMVKLDRSMITRATYGKRLNFSLARLVALLHEAGCLVVAEGIETEEEALVALDANVDLVQGFYFARPFLDIKQSSLIDNKCEYIHEVFRQKVAKEVNKTRQSLMPYIRYLKIVVSGIMAGAEVNNSIETSNTISKNQKTRDLRRIYIIGENGHQNGSAINISTPRTDKSTKLIPLTDSSNANWNHRPYFRKAIDSPNTVHCSGPYLSMTDAAMCLTLSVAIKQEEQTIVVCCDIDWTSSVGNSPTVSFIPLPLHAI